MRWLATEILLPLLGREVAVGYPAGPLLPGCRIDIPAASRPVQAAGYQALAVVQKQNARHPIQMSAQRLSDRLPAGDVPELNGAILTACRHQRTRALRNTSLSKANYSAHYDKFTIKADAE